MLAMALRTGLDSPHYFVGDADKAALGGFDFEATKGGPFGSGRTFPAGNQLAATYLFPTWINKKATFAIRYLCEDGRWARNFNGVGGAATDDDTNTARTGCKIEGAVGTNAAWGATPRTFTQKNGSNQRIEGRDLSVNALDAVVVWEGAGPPKGSGVAGASGKSHDRAVQTSKTHTGTCTGSSSDGFSSGHGTGARREKFRALDGYAAGARDAARANSLIGQCGGGGRVIYFAVDYGGVPSSDYGYIKAYFDGAISVISYDRVGVYGTYAVCQMLVAACKARFLWASAWLGPVPDWKNLHIVQTNTSQAINTVVGSPNCAVLDTFGQWRPPSS